MNKILILIILLNTLLFSNIGKITALSGTAYLERNNNNLDITTGMSIHKSDIVNTNNNSKLQILFKDNSVITLGKNAKFKINDYEFNPKNPKNSKVNFKFLKGAFKTITGKIGKLNKKNYKLTTKSASIGIRGSIGAGNQDNFFTLNGGYGITKGGVTVELTEGMMTNISGDRPTPAREFTQEDLGTLGLGIVVKKPRKKAETSEKPKKSTKKDSGSKDGKKDDSSTKKDGDEKSKEDGTDKKDDGSGNNEEESDTTQEDSTDQEDTDEQNNDDNEPDGSVEPEQNDGGNDNQDSPTATTTPVVVAPTVEAVQETDTTDALEKELADKLAAEQLAAAEKLAAEKLAAEQLAAKVAAEELAAQLAAEQLAADLAVQNADDGTRPADDTTPPVTEVTEYVYSGEFFETTDEETSSGNSTINFSYNESKLYSSNSEEDGSLTLTINDVQTVLSTGEGSNQIVFNEIIENGFKSPLTPSLAYKIYTDNQNEFFILSGNTLNNENNEIASLLYAGLQPSRVNIGDTHDIFIADHYKSLLKHDPYLIDEGYEKVIYNAQTNKGTNLTYQNDYNSFSLNETDGTFIADIITGEQTNTIEGGFYGNNNGGTSFQGIGFVEKDGASVERISTFTHLANSDKEFAYSSNTDLSQYLQVSFFNSTYQGDYLNSVTNTFEISFDEANSSTTTITTIGDFLFNFNVQLNGYEDQVDLSSSSLSSYFINDDLFGTTLTGHSVSTPSYLFAIPDRIDENDNPVFADDSSSWGYWTKTDGQENFTNGTWVSGTQIDMMPLMIGASTQTFNTQGHMIGYVTAENSAVGAIIVDQYNILELNFELGGSEASFSGVLNFTANVDGEGVIFHHDFSYQELTTDGSFFDIVPIVQDGPLTGSLNGSFYGDGDLKSTGGSFSLTNDSGYSANGSFKTTVTP